MKDEIDYIYNIPKFSKKASLDNTREMLDRLGIREEAMKILHVAGTNGKGSVCACLESILRQSGHTVGLFTSPHLVDIRERIRINGELVTEKEFEETFARVKKVSLEMQEKGYAHPSFFEFLFGMGMLIFQNHKVEYLVLETGLGGRLDATNVIRHPLACVITSISLDHTEILGDTYAKIAYEKAGILKEGAPAVFLEDREDVTEVILSRAKEVKAIPYPLSKSKLKAHKTGDNKVDFSLGNGYYDNEYFCVPSNALYQAENAALAVLTAHTVLSVSYEEIQTGLDRMNWSGRMQTLEPQLVVDGAHNEDGIRRFLESVACDGEDGNRVLLLSAVADKHYEAMIAEICESCLFSHIHVGQLAGSRALPLTRFQEVFAGFPETLVDYEPDVAGAYHKLRGDIAAGRMAYIAGSLYLAGEVLALYSKETGENHD